MAQDFCQHQGLQDSLGHNKPSSTDKLSSVSIWNRREQI